MIKTTHTLICDHCNEEIVNKDNATVVYQGKFIGFEIDQFGEVKVIDAKAWHYHLLCYDEQEYQRHSKPNWLR